MTAAPATGWTFDRHTVVDPATGAAQVTPELGGFLGASGGYVAALALRALHAAVGDPGQPARSVTVQLLRPAQPGAVTVPGTVERRGRSTTVAAARVRQDGETMALAQGTFGAPSPSVARMDLAMPDVPGPDDCAPLVDQPVPEASMSTHIERRPARGPLPLSGADAAEIFVWMRLGEDRPVDPLSAVFLADAAVPGVYATLREAVRMPSVEIAMHFPPAPRGAPQPWLLGVFRNLLTGDGYVIEDGELWTPDGELVVLTRQLRRVLP